MKLSDEQFENIFHDAKAGKDLFEELDRVLNEYAPHEIIRPGFFDSLFVGSNRVNKDDSDRVTPITHVFYRGIGELVTKSALLGYILGHHHAKAGELIAHICNRNYKVKGKDGQTVSGGCFYDTLCESAATIYMAAKVICSKQDALLILSKMPDQQIRKSLAKRLPEELRPQVVLSAAFFQCRNDYYKQKRILPVTLKKRNEMAEVSGRIFSL